ncbi:MAG: sugar phosphate isomerase/epimerase [Agathobacter sp.]|uniref:sugar phosphate isomerase/epimerase family protein n=1 Tax=Agathobacter sp. TaxID=2021311 RepID=UPI002585CD1E|nr:sugar phosphate isomerase/epimerase [Agathobacter sp.]MCR5678152.1 sugar phosphate isomerase/epimerase [Agathobacter sp.]
MKAVASFGIVNADTSGPGAFLRAAKWYWDDLTDMVAAAGFRSIMIPMVPNTENVSRNGAPICTASIRTHFGSLSGYLHYLNDKGIDNVEVITISAQAQYNSLFETGKPIEEFYNEFYLHAKDVMEALIELKGSTLLVSPTPGIGFLNQIFQGNQEKLDGFCEEAAACMNRIGQKAKEMGINFAIKNEYWTMMRGANIDAFMEKVDRELVSYTPDPAHLFIAGTDPIAYFNRYASQMKVAYFTDTKFVDKTDAYRSISPEFPQDGDMQRVYYDLGNGQMDFATMYAKLKEVGFDGPVVLDCKYATDIPKAVLRTRTFWTKLEKGYLQREGKS